MNQNDCEDCYSPEPVKKYHTVGISTHIVSGINEYKKKSCRKISNSLLVAGGGLEPPASGL